MPVICRSWGSCSGEGYHWKERTGTHTGVYPQNTESGRIIHHGRAFCTSSGSGFAKGGVVRQMGEKDPCFASESWMDLVLSQAH